MTNDNDSAAMRKALAYTANPLPYMLHDALKETGWVFMQEASDEAGVARLRDAISRAGFQIIKREG